MSEHDHNPQTSSHAPDNGDGTADVIAAIVLIALVVSGVSFWLHSFAS